MDTPGGVNLQWTASLAQGVAHDLANLLMVVSSRSRFALNVLPSDSEAKTHVLEVAAAAARAVTLVRHLTWTEASPDWRPQLVDVNGLIGALEPVFGVLFRRNVKVHVRTTAGVGVAYLDGARLERTLLDLAVCCSRLSTPLREFSVTTKTRELDDRIAEAFHLSPAPHTLIAVSCADCAVVDNSFDRILQHWTTSKEQPVTAWRDSASGCARLPEGAGYLLAEHANGQYQLSIYLPPASLKASGTARVPAQATHRGTVLVAEDEIRVRRLVSQALRARGYSVLEAGTGAEALEIADLHGATIDVLVTDMHMPGMTGRALATTLREYHPRLRTVFMSGSDVESLLGLEPREAAAFLGKPFEMSALSAIVATLLGDSQV